MEAVSTAALDIHHRCFKKKQRMGIMCSNMTHIKSGQNAYATISNPCLMGSIFILLSLLTVSCQSRHGYHSAGGNTSDMYVQRILEQTETSHIHTGRLSCEEAVMEMETFFCSDFPEARPVVQEEKTIEGLLIEPSFTRHRIGVMLPVSGAYQKIGHRVLKAVEMAFDSFNKNGTGHRYSMILKDTGSDPAKAVAAVKSLGEEGVAGIIGPLATAREAAMVADELGIPMIVLTQKQDVPQIGRYIFRSFITPEMQAEALISYLMEDIGIRRFAVMYPDESYGVSFKDAFASTLQAFGGKLNASEPYHPGQTDFALAIKNFIKGYQVTDKDGDVKILNIDDPRKRHGNYRAIVDFEALFIPDSAEMAAMISPQLKFHDIDDIILIGTNLWSSEDLIEMAGPYVQGAIFPSGFDMEDTDHKVDDFVSRYASVDDAPPGFIEAIGFDTVSIMLRALSLPGTKSRDDLVNSLLAIHAFNGLTGMSSFKPSGEPVIDLKLCRIVSDRSSVIFN